MLPTRAPRYATPLRFPGGKGPLFDVLAGTISANSLIGCTYIEPFAGGAGAALRLLYGGYVENIVLNDIDTHIAAVWRSMINSTTPFIQRVYSTPVDIEEWKKQRDIYRNHSMHSEFDVGFATFYLNRCNRSGILRNGSAIGGLEQNGKWKIDARFNKEMLVRRIEQIGLWRSYITMLCMDARDLISNIDDYTTISTKRFVYLDPPYYKCGSELYLNALSHSDHYQLSKVVRGFRHGTWMMTYDNHTMVRQLYNKEQTIAFNFPYSANGRRSGRELLIAPWNVQLPESLMKRTTIQE